MVRISVYVCRGLPNHPVNRESHDRLQLGTAGTLGAHCTRCRRARRRTDSGWARHAGAPGYQSFTFRATEAGDATLTLHYLRPFERNTPPAGLFRCPLPLRCDLGQL